MSAFIAPKHKTFLNTTVAIALTATATALFIFTLKSWMVPEDATIFSGSQERNSVVQVTDPQKVALLLEDAHQLASQGHYADAIARLKMVSPTTEPLLYARSQQQMLEYSRHLLAIAEAYYRDPSGQLKEAIRVASALEPETPFYAAAQTHIQQWQAEWHNNAAYLNDAIDALEANEPANAEQAASRITNHPYWLPQKTKVLQQVENQQPQNSLLRLMPWGIMTLVLMGIKKR